MPFIEGTLFLLCAFYIYLGANLVYEYGWYFGVEHARKWYLDIAYVILSLFVILFWLPGAVAMMCSNSKP